MTISHDCAQVERDNVSLHTALTEAIRRMSTAARVLREHKLGGELPVLAEVTLSTSDLLAVLTRTAEPVVRPDCDCGAGWTNGYRDGQHASDRSGEHSRYCARHGAAEYLDRLARARVPVGRVAP